MKKRMILFFGTFLLTIFLSAAVSAESCSVTERASCSNTIVMGLSASTNAHGELASQGNYNYVLCCDGSGSTTCDTTNKIIGLGALETNAHAEIPSKDNYAYDVCYGGFTCASNTDSCPTGYDIEMLSLTGETNAHIGGFDDYSIKICCSAGVPPPPPGEPYWRDEDGDTDLNNDGTSESLEEIIVVLDTTRVFATIFDSDLTPGTSVSADVYEDDLLVDDFIRTLTGIVYSDNNINLSWTITQADIDETSDLDNFYFEINGVRSNNELKFDVTEPGVCSGISACVHYTTEAECNEDICDVADDCIDEVDCGLPEYTCGCEWNETEDECRPFWEYHPTPPLPGVCGDGNIDPGEQCDGGIPAGFDCTDFDDFTGGSLSCVDCMLDTSGCTGGEGGYCGDGVIDAGETCDGSEWGDITGCSDFDGFTGGTLDCDSECNFDTSACTGGEGPGTCGNGIINAGEQCDGSEWGDITGCSDFDGFTGGTLDCDSECNFDTSACTGGSGGYCGDGTIDAGEQCDGSIPSEFSCSDFDDFSDDFSLLCTNCMLDTSGCAGGIGGPSVIGKCTYDETTTDTCEDDGILEYSWLGIWKWDSSNIFDSNPGGYIFCSSTGTCTCSDCDGKWHYDPEKKNELCVGGSEELHCPAELELPFFGFYNFIIAILSIALIYLYLNRNNL